MAAEAPEAPETTSLKHYTTNEIAESGKWYDQPIGPFPAYLRLVVQVVLLSFVLFLCPGCFNAITGIGGSGISDPVVADHQNIALYCTFLVGLYGGVLVNKFGPRACLVFGGTGYLVYVGSLLSFQRNGNAGFCIFAGAYLGVCALIVWAAQGLIVMSYSTESTKGKFFALNWIIFNVGAVIGGCIPLAQAISTGLSNASGATFAAFMVLVGLGCIVAFMLLPMDKVYKMDGTRVVAHKNPTLGQEIRGLWRVLTKDLRIYFLFPMFAASNWFYTYQFNNYNGGGRFDLKTRSLNLILYWFSQMVGALAIGALLDWSRYRRLARAKIGWIFIFVLGMAIWGGGLKFQLGWDRDLDIKAMDFHDRSYIGPMFLYMFYGLYDAMFQSYVIWLLGSMSNNPKTTAFYASLYKSVQSAFAAIAWALDSRKTSFMAMFGSSWGLVCGLLIIACPLVFFLVTDHTDAVADGMADLLDEKSDEKLEKV